DVPIEVATRIRLWAEEQPVHRPGGSPRGPLNIGPRRNRAVVMLKKEIGSRVTVHVAHAHNVPTEAGIAKAEAVGVGASSVVAHDLIVNDRQLPDRDVAVVMLEHKILTRIIGVKPLFCEVSHAHYMPSRPRVREVRLNVEVDLRAHLRRVLPD